MFYVCSAPAPQPLVRPSLCAPLAPLPPHTPFHLPEPAPRPAASHAPPWARQDASAFNQPLSFDTSSVTNMRYIFHVRSPRVPWPPSV